MKQLKTNLVRHPARRRAQRCRLNLEGLETRWLPHIGLAGPAFQAIPQPIAPYLAQTSKLDITVPDFTSVASLSDGTLTTSFSLSGQARTAGVTWGSWSSSPDSESDTPRVLFFQNFTLETTISLNAPVLTFGFEVQPNVQDVFSVTATFEDRGGNVLGAITRDVSGRAGARLFAGTDVSGTGISSVVIAVDAPAQGFGVAQVRYSRSNLALAGPYVTASAPTDPVQSLDHVTVTFNQPTDPATFTPDQVTLTDPNGNPVTITQDHIVPNADGTVYTISFNPRTALGQYTLTVGPNVTDVHGNPMDQDFDGIPGEPTDVYHAAFTVTNELVINGGFETGDFSGWSRTIEDTFVGSSPNPPHSGRFAAQVSSFGDLQEFFSQDLSTTPGATYHISFSYFRDGRTPANLQVFWGPFLNIYSEFDSAAHDYVEHTIDLVATDTTTRLAFFVRNERGFDALDDVSVTKRGGRVGDVTLASSLVTPATVRVSPAAVAPAAVTIDHPAANLDQYFAAPATPLDPVVASLRPAPVNPVYDPLNLLGGLDGWTL
jgi:hypothetical protein